jgi:hypothetical protein
MKNVGLWSLLWLLCFVVGCKEGSEQRKKVVIWVEPAKRVEVSYHILSLKDSGKAVLDSFNDEQKNIIYALNRVDKENIRNLDTIIVPNQFVDYMQYSPFPFGVQELKEVKKIIFFSYKAQAFGAYENGKLVRWGPTNMGREKDQTPTGLFYANWKAEKTTSTFNDEWELKWNFNIENKLGVGWHQYTMPGYPASHSCLRLYETDAKYLYDWADQWVLEGTDNVKAKGTPTVVFGSYPFGQPKPWWAMAQNGKALEMSSHAIYGEVDSYIEEILHEQEKREQFVQK